MPLKQRRLMLLMHNWAGYLAGVQLGIADYLAQRPAWMLSRHHPNDIDMVMHASPRPDAVIAFVEPAHVARLKSLKVPVVDLSDWENRDTFLRVLPDNRLIGEMAADYLMDLGLKHFAARRQEGAAFSVARIGAFANRLSRAGFSTDVFGARRHRLPEHVKTPPLVNRAMAAWLIQMPKPAGVFVVTDQRAVDVLEACRHLGIRVPQELCVIGVDNDELINRFTHPQLTSIALPTQKIGFEAARIAEAMMNRRDVPASPVLFAPVGVVARQSTDVLMIPDEDVLAAVRYIREHAARRISVRDILRAVPLNRRALERRFQQHLGRTPLQEIQRVRLDRAKHLLGSTDLPISAIARESGYHSAWRLARVFHTTLGITPTAYRGSLRADFT